MCIIQCGYVKHEVSVCVYVCCGIYLQACGCVTREAGVFQNAVCYLHVSEMRK